MPSNLKITATADLPIIGAKTFSIPDALVGMPDSAAASLLALDGGQLKGTCRATASADGVELSIDADLGPLGNKTLTMDEKLAGLEKDVVDELIAIDGGAIDLAISVAEA